MNDSQTANGSNEGKGGASWLKWVLIGCGGFLALMVILIVVLFFVVKQVTAGPEEVVQTFLAEAAAGNLEASYDCFSAPLKEVQPFAEFSSAVTQNRQFFDISDTSFSERSVDMQGAKLSGTATLAAGTQLPCSFELVRENDEWKLLSYNIGAGGD